MHRRAFMLGAAAVLAGHRARAWQADAAELVVANARVYTMDAAMPRAEAFAVARGRFAAVGSNDAIRRLIGKSAQVMDAEQMTIVPGFIGTHNHAGGTTLLYQVLVGNPFDVVGGVTRYQA